MERKYCIKTGDWADIYVIFRAIGYVEDEETYQNLIKDGRDLRRWPLEVVVSRDSDPICYCSSCGQQVKPDEINKHLSGEEDKTDE